jgi:hypothetical protein
MGSVEYLQLLDWTGRQIRTGLDGAPCRKILSPSLNDCGSHRSSGSSLDAFLQVVPLECRPHEIDGGRC